MNKDKNLVWIDLEMTGLDTSTHVIVEIGVLVTDNELNIIAEGPSLVIHQPESKLEEMDQWVRNVHSKSGLTEEVRKSTVDEREAEEQVLMFLEQHCWAGSSPLCGNSVGTDKAFLVRYMPRIAGFLHYRVIDVSSVKELVRRWYPGNPATEFKKSDGHRALEDIRASVAELKHYRTNFFK